MAILEMGCKQRVQEAFQHLMSVLATEEDRLSMEWRKVEEQKQEANLQTKMAQDLMSEARAILEVSMAALPGPIYADAVAVEIDLEADDEPQMTYPSWWKCKHAAKVVDWERLLLSTIDAGEYVYTVYEKAGNRQYCSIDLYLLQAAERPTHNQWERAVNLVMRHRLRTLEWWADVLQMDVRRLTKLGSEHLLLQWMRKPSAARRRLQ
ncbi:tatB [Symbiodinium sp. CCMP2456]|nr:tatB [Symbiodinium sp. CCMP2456]